jgi:hypothetical protein
MMREQLNELPIELTQGDLVTRYVEWNDMAVRYARVPAGTDMGPVLEGLPNDRCPSPHWGIVLEGSITLVHADGTKETTSAGEAYYWPAGHTAFAEEAVAFLEIGPVAEMRAFGEHAQAKLDS